MFVTYFFGCLFLPTLLCYIDLDIVKLGKLEEERESTYYTKSLAHQMQGPLGDEEAALGDGDDIPEAEAMVVEEVEDKDIAGEEEAAAENEDVSPSEPTEEEVALEDVEDTSPKTEGADADATVSADETAGTVAVSDEGGKEALHKQASF